MREPLLWRLFPSWKRRLDAKIARSVEWLHNHGDHFHCDPDASCRND